MNKWFENVNQTRGENFISSRVRLTRNWDEYAFPNRLNVQQAGELVGRLEDGLSDIAAIEAAPFRITTLDRLPETERLTLKERRIMNAQIAEAKQPCGLILSEAEDVSLLLNGDDHIRIQCLSPGLNLETIYRHADKLDDYVNSRFNYAYDEKYGYLTSYPTSMGTGMRANIVLHLPSLAKTDDGRNFIENLSKFGVSIRSVYGKNKEHFGALYDVSNNKTLGINEKEIIALVTRVANQLNDKEAQLREASFERHFLLRQDEAYRAYGIMKYARTMSVNSALTFLSQLRSGLADGVIETLEPCSIYKLMLEIQTGNLLMKAERPMDQRELDAWRADYLRANLPIIKEA